MNVYLDNSSTTRAYKECAELVADVMYNSFGNPSSLHRKGIEAEKIIKTAREQFADTIKASANEVYFTSGGTESDNLAIIGACRASRGKHIISTSIEHPAVLNTLQHLEKRGYAVDLLPVSKSGIIDVSKVAKLIRKDTALISCMYVNNEIGSIQPVEKIAKIIKSENPSTVFHIDAVQAYGKIPFSVSSVGADLISFSGHKIHGPKGVGALYVRNKTKLSPIIFGGGQQNNIRPGTENVPGIVGIGEAARCVFENFSEKQERLYELREYFVSRLEQMDGVKVNGFAHRISDRNLHQGSAPHVISASFENIRAEVLLHALEERGIYVSSGSACSSNHPAISGTLKAIGVEKKYLDATIRFSLCYDTTEEEVNGCLEVLEALVPMLRRFTRGGRR